MLRKSGKNLFADFFRKRLAFGDVFLAVAFGAMAKHFVEKNGSGAARQQAPGPPTAR